MTDTASFITRPSDHYPEFEGNIVSLMRFGRWDVGFKAPWTVHAVHISRGQQWRGLELDVASLLKFTWRANSISASA
jgi:hypothetical protein